MKSRLLLLIFLAFSATLFLAPAYAMNATITTISVSTTTTVLTTTTIPANTLTSKLDPIAQTSLMSAIQNAIGSNVVYLNQTLNSFNNSPSLTPSQFTAFSNAIIAKEAQIPQVSMETTASTYQYGSLLSNGNYVKAGASLTFVSVDQYTGAVNVYNLSIAKDPSYICINLTSSLFSENICKPGNYHLPVVEHNGYFGLSGVSKIPITATLTTSLLANNKLPFSAEIEVGGNTLLLFSNSNMSTFSQSYSFNYSVGEGLNISFEGTGNANYTSDDPVVTPSNVVYYRSITLTNNQASAFSANTPVNYTFDAGALKKYLTANLINVDFFYVNGTVIPSELWGNFLNLQQTTNLYTSNNLMYWLNVTNSIAANGNSLTIYQGFAGNVATSANTLMDGIKTGSVAGLQISGSCGGLDNGKKVFAYWLSWSCLSALPSGWTGFSGGSGTISYNTYNTVLSIAAVGTWGGVNAVAPASLAVGNYLDVYGNMFPDTLALSRLFVTADTGQASNFYLGVGASCTACAGTPVLSGTSNGGTASTGVAATNTLQLYTAVYPTSTTGNVASNFVFNHLTGLTETSAQNLGWEGYAASGAPSVSTLYWIDLRLPPPNDIMPAITNGTVQSAYTAPTVTISSASNAISDVGQTVTFTATVTGGNQPVAYTYNVVNSVTPGTIVAQTAFVGCTLTSNTMTFTANTAMVTNSPIKANVVINDGTTTTNSIYSATFQVNAALVANGITPSAPTIDNGQSIILTATPTLGSPNYLISFFSQAACAGSALSTSGPVTSNTAKVSPIATTTYTYNVVDSATTNSVACSTSDIVTVNPAQTANTLLVSNAVIVTGQNSILTAGAQSGTPSYTFSWFPNAGCTGTSIGSGITLSVSPSSTTTYSFNSVDSAYSPNSICSASNTVTVHTSPILSFPNFPQSGTSSQSYTVQGSITSSAGTPKATLYVNGNPYGTFNSLINYTTTAPGTYLFNITVTGNSTVNANSISQQLTIYAASTGASGGGGLSPTTTIKPTSNKTVVQPQTVAFEGTGNLLAFSIPTMQSCAANYLACGAGVIFGTGIQITYLQTVIPIWAIVAGVLIVIGFLNLIQSSHQKPMKPYYFVGASIIILFWVAYLTLA